MKQTTVPFIYPNKLQLEAKVLNVGGHRGHLGHYLGNDVGHMLSEGTQQTLDSYSDPRIGRLLHSEETGLTKSLIRAAAIASATSQTGTSDPHAPAKRTKKG